MAERRKVSLLDCAIVASGAVVPVLIGVVALVAVVRPADPDAAWRQGKNDRYVSVRHVAALKTFERAIVARGRQAPAAIDAAQVLDGVAACRREWGVRTGALPWLRRTVLGGVAESAPADEIAARLNELDAALLRFSARASPRVEQRVGLDAARWFGAAGEALATPIETAEAPGQQFRVRCADLSAALATLRRGDAAMLENLAWRGTEGSATLARWRPEQQMQVAARDVTRRNPWAGAAGCIYFGAGDGVDASASPRYFLASARSLQRRLCATTALSGAASATAASGADATAPLPLAGEPGRNDARRRSALDGAAVAADAAAAARAAAPADRRALPALHRGRGRGRRARSAQRRRRRRQSHRHRRRRARRRLLDRRDHRSGAAGAGAEDRGLLHRPARHLSRARAAPQGRRRPCASASSCSKGRWCGWPRSR